MNLIFSDNVDILCSYVKTSKTTVRLCKKIESRTKHLFMISIMSSVNTSLLLLPFLQLVNVNRVSEKIYLGQ